MREIKFRGKRFDENDNNWIYGHLHMIDTCGYGYTGKAIQQQSGKERPWSVRVKDETIGQYTGLKDKNGKEIYEGDIIEGGYLNPLTNEFLSRKYLVKYENGCFKGILIGHTPYGDTWLQFIKGEVIGNIYEDKELLEV